MPSPAQSSAANAGLKSEEYLSAQINGLRDVTLQMEDEFIHIESEIRGLGPKIQRALKGGQRNGVATVLAEIDKYLQRWSGYNQDFQNLVWDSRKVASAVQTAASEMSGLCKELLKRGYEGSEDRLRRCIMFLADHENAAERVSQGFKDLRKKIGDFLREWLDFVKSHQVANATGPESSLMKLLGESVAHLEVWFKGLIHKVFAFDQVVPFMTQLCAKVGTSVGAFAVLRAIARGVRGLIHATATCCASHLFDDDFTGMTRLLDDDGDSIVKQVMIDNDLNTGRGRELSSSLAALCKVWATIAADIRQVKYRLEIVNPQPGSGVDNLFRKRLSQIAKSYENLGKALYRYQTQVVL